MTRRFPANIIEYMAFTAIERRFQLKTSQPPHRTDYEEGGSALGSPRNDLPTRRALSTSAESRKAGGRARDKVRNSDGRKECRFLSPYLGRWPKLNMETTPKCGNSAGILQDQF